LGVDSKFLLQECQTVNGAFLDPALFSLATLAGYDEHRPVTSHQFV